MLGAYRSTIGALLNPFSCVIDKDDQIYVAESSQHRIAVFATSGKLIRTFGRKGSSDGELHFPAGLALGTDGKVYVSDSGNHRICVFDHYGKFHRSWGGYGSVHGKMIRPAGLAVAGDRVFVADAGNDRVQVFDIQGRETGVFGGWGSKPGHFKRPVGVAVGNENRLYVLDRDNSRVQVFDADGGNPRVWGEWGPFPGMLGGPQGMCFHRNQLYIADTMNHRIQVMEPNGRMAYQWGIHAFMPREGEGKLHYPNAIAVAPSGHFAVVCEGFENRCQIFDLMPPGQTPPTSPFVQNDPSGQSHFGITSGLSRNLIALSEEEIDQVSIHNLVDGAAVRIAMIGQHGVRAGQFVRPSGLDLNATDSTLVVGDAGNRRLQEFKLKQDPPGQLRFIPQMATLSRTLDFSALQESAKELRDRAVIEPTIVRRDADGAIFVLDAVQNVVVELDRDFEVQRVWQPDEGGRSWISPTDLSLDPAGKTLFISDAGRGTISSYALDGRRRAEWKADSLAAPAGVAVCPDGGVYVSDEFAHRILKFDAKGKLLNSWGSEGLGAGQLFRPRGLMLTEAGNVVVIDHGNHRCQVFTADGKYLNVFGATYFIRPAQRGMNDANNEN